MSLSNYNISSLGDSTPFHLGDARSAILLIPRSTISLGCEETSSNHNFAESLREETQEGREQCHGTLRHSTARFHLESSAAAFKPGSFQEELDQLSSNRSRRRNLNGKHHHLAVARELREDSLDAKGTSRDRSHGSNAALINIPMKEDTIGRDHSRRTKRQQPKEASVEQVHSEGGIEIATQNASPGSASADTVTNSELLPGIEYQATHHSAAEDPLTQSAQDAFWDQDILSREKDTDVDAYFENGLFTRCET